ncbi:MAG: SurA N-terminal domain-containing protein [Acidobacteriales bacterium]|nr:SurA N-terminal domain-containing protein [Terriglobales bacterium]
MFRLTQLAILALLLPLAQLRAGEVLDRIVATVNGTAILESDWDEAVRFECFLEQRPLSSLTPADLKATLERLIDQTLIQQQMQAAKFSMLSPEEAAQRVSDLRVQAAHNWEARSPSENWQEALAKYGLDEHVFELHAALQVQALRFIDLRFRPNIHIDRGKVETYYREKLLPELRRNGEKQAPLAEVSPKIEEILVQQTMDEMLTAWLRDLRAQSEVEVR